MVWADFMVGQRDVTKGAVGGAGAWGELNPGVERPVLMAVLWGWSCIERRWMQKGFAGKGRKLS